MKIRPILRVLAFALIGISIIMTIPGLVALGYGAGPAEEFFASAAITFVTGIVLFASTRNEVRCC